MKTGYYIADDEALEEAHKKSTFRVHGTITYNEADTEDGLDTVEIDEYIEAETATDAFDLFLENNEQYEFYGCLKMLDADTRGGKWAIFEDQNEGQTITVDLD